MDQTTETNINSAVPPVPQSRIKWDIIKVIILLILASFFAWIFVFGGMAFEPINLNFFG